MKFSLALLFIVPVFGTTFNAVTDFSTGSNPNGVWSYGSSPNSSSPLTLFTFAEPDPQGNYWVNQPFSSGFPNYYPLLRRNTTGSTIDFGSGFVLPEDVVYMAPGNTLESIVRFTAPSAGTWNFTGQFVGLQNGGGSQTNIDAFAVLNLNTVETSGQINANGTVPIGFQLALIAGDTIDFRVDSQGDNNGDSTGLRLSVQSVSSSVPEPGTLSAIAGGLLLLAGVRGARRFEARRALR